MPLVITELTEFSDLQHFPMCNDILLELTNLTRYILLSYLSNPVRLNLTLPNCKESVSDLSISKLWKLQSLNIIACSLVTNNSITCLTQLTELKLNYSSSVDDEGLSVLTNLTSLHLRDTSHISVLGMFSYRSCRLTENRRHQKLDEASHSRPCAHEYSGLRVARLDESHASKPA